MVSYEDDDLIAAPRHIVWKVLEDHLDDKKILTVHPLVQSQKTVSRTGSGTVVDRVIDVARKPKKSRWKLILEPPDHFRWEVLESEGPWTPGSYLDLHYEEVPGGTRVRSRGELSVRPLPVFFSQKRAVGQALIDLTSEDWNYINRFRF